MSDWKLEPQYTNGPPHLVRKMSVMDDDHTVDIDDEGDLIVDLDDKMACIPMTLIIELINKNDQYIKGGVK